MRYVVFAFRGGIWWLDSWYRSGELDAAFERADALGGYVQDWFTKERRPKRREVRRGA